VTGRSPLTATWWSPAKVNLCLRVVGRRADGYHLLDSIFVAIDLCDRITVVVRDVRPGGAIAVEATVSMPEVPADGRNLAARAVTAVLTEAGMGAAVALTLEKRIPPGAGLGGGSGNAATVLRGVNDLLGLGVSSDRLAALALALGADVPFFLTGGAARVRGIGEDVQPIAGWPDLRLVLALPPFGVETAAAFRTMAGLALVPGNEAAMLAAGAAPTQDLLVNDLERAVVPAHPAIGALGATMRKAGATAAVMSGSGSTVVGIVPTDAGGAAVVRAIQNAHPGVRAHLCRPCAATAGGASSG
jgi:4-diphosphocytidyl-2-C-methyl-D-erythritol kinase